MNRSTRISLCVCVYLLPQEVSLTRLPFDLCHQVSILHPRFRTYSARSIDRSVPPAPDIKQTTSVLFCYPGVMSVRMPAEIRRNNNVGRLADLHCFLRRTRCCRFRGGRSDDAVARFITRARFTTRL